MQIYLSIWGILSTFAAEMLVENDILIPQMAELLREGKQVKFTPQGQSMMPAIVGGVDCVVMAAPVSLKKGNIVLARLPYPHDAQPLWVLHRIIHMDGDMLVLKGDNNPTMTESCRVGDVVGVVVKVKRRSTWRYWWRKVKRAIRAKYRL